MNGRDMRRNPRATGAVLAALLAVLLASTPGAFARADRAPAPGSTSWPTPWPTAPDPGTTLPVLTPSPPVVTVQGQVSRVADERETLQSRSSVDARLSARLLFAKDSAQLRPGARARLDALVAALRSRPAGRLLVQGFTDDLGTAGHGLVLSRARAGAVADVLRPALPRQEVVTEGLGEAQPLVPNVDEASRSRNRRVEVHWRAS